jgi:hypothetical protein
MHRSPRGERCIDRSEEKSVSDIGMPAGFGAFLVAGGLGIVFLLASVIYGGIVGAQGRRAAPAAPSPPGRHRAVAHLRGLLLCLFGYATVAAFCLTSDWSLRDAYRWLDNNIPLWAGGVLALWPLSVLAGRLRAVG